MRLYVKDRKDPTAAPFLSTSCRLTVDDHITLDWRNECPSSDVNISGPLKHILLNIRSVGIWKGIPSSLQVRVRGLERQSYVSTMYLSKYLFNR